MYATETTEQVTCDCGCGETVTLAYTGGFAGTTCTLSACTTRRAAGVVEVTLRRSTAITFAAPGSSVASHIEGLVVFPWERA